MGDWCSFYKNIKEIYGDEPEHGIIEYIDLVEKGKVLDLGVGDGRNSLFLANMGYDVCGVDISKENVELFNSKAKRLGLDVNSILGDIRDINIEENEYSLIILSWVLNFFNKSDIDKILAKAKKGLKKGGLIHFYVFTNLDYFYESNKDKKIDEENTYYTKDEVLEYFKDLELVSFREGKVLDMDPRGKHYHNQIEYIGIK